MTDPAQGSRQLLAEFAKYCDKKQTEIGVRISQVTANKYHQLLRYMTEYIHAQYRTDDLPLEQVNYEYIDDLNPFFQTIHDCKNNGAVNLLCCQKNFTLFCLRNEWISKNPFQHYKMKIDKTNVKTILTKAELDILIRKPMSKERLGESGTCSHSAVSQGWPLPTQTTCARNTFACLAVEYGMPIDVLAKILGHTNTNMTR